MFFFVDFDYFWNTQYKMDISPIGDISMLAGILKNGTDRKNCLRSMTLKVTLTN